ncbi:nucleotidyl transferase AbiEii/AbiGii toxin family protein [Sphaerochaeta sp.]|nr:nucleotidyl transferase AbiEii/AbiGii toxin family protein [Sphaerochaeta sp.]MDD3424074.1 nucleotidyl transferase AbiEii/AbiGii toxin family protein [Sphaerochaeta sp.]
MNVYAKQEIEAIAAKTHFIKSNVEKVVRLIDILSYIHTTSPDTGEFALKGGTAINLCILDIPRLSVDIDLDFAQNLSKEDTAVVRQAFKRTFNEFVLDSGYSISEKARGHYAMDSFLLTYDTISGNTDNIRVEINYLDRAHILPYCVLSTIMLGSHKAQTRMLDPLELIASKANALLSRQASRDLYDMYQLIQKGIISDIPLFRKCLVFYNLVGGGMDIDTISSNVLKKYTYNEIKKYLKPVLAKNDDFSCDRALLIVKEFLDEVLVLNEKEKQFCKDFRNGAYNPGLLFDDETTIERIHNHPMAVWRTRATQ